MPSAKRTERASDWKDRIKGSYASLSRNQRKVADFLLHYGREVPFLSIAELERRTGASKATIVRLAQSLGFAGFLEMRAMMLEGVRSEYRDPELFQFRPPRSSDEALIAVAHQDVRNINQTISQLDRKAFHHVARMLVKAPHVYTVGLGVSALLSQVLTYSLNQVAVRATAFVHGYETFYEQLPLLGKSDVVVAFSFPPYSRETVDLVRAAADRRIRVIGISDRVTSPIGTHCVHVLPIRSQNKLFTNSISAIMVVINALATEVALHNRRKAAEAIQTTERLMHDSGHYTPT